MEEKAKHLAQLLKVLANQNRLLLLCALMESPKTVSALAARVPNITQSALSQHLQLLRAHGIVDFNKCGQSITYCVADQRVTEIIHTLKQYYCEWFRRSGAYQLP